MGVLYSQYPDHGHEAAAREDVSQEVYVGGRVDECGHIFFICENCLHPHYRAVENE